MLVLSRKAEEAILIPGAGISIKVLGVYGDRVKLGIDAPAEQKIIRAEIQGRETILLRAAESDGPTTAA